jgi:hypothetical protein
MLHYHGNILTRDFQVQTSVERVKKDIYSIVQILSPLPFLLEIIRETVKYGREFHGTRIRE